MTTLSGFPRHAASCAWPIWIQIAPCGLVERSERPVGGIQAPRPADGLSRCPRARTIERMALAASSCKANCSRATRTAPPATDAPSREPPAVPPRPRVSIVRRSTPGSPAGGAALSLGLKNGVQPPRNCHDALITRRSQVRILSPLPRNEQVRHGKMCMACFVLSDPCLTLV